MSLRERVIEVLGVEEDYSIGILGRLVEAGYRAPPLGRLRRTLRALEREGELDARQGDPVPARGGRPRIYYQRRRST